jgi:hypothetical protein
MLRLTGATKGLPTVAEAEAAGLYHPNCIHYNVVVLPSEMEAAEQRQEDIDGERKELARLDAEAEKEAQERQRERDVTLREERLEQLERGRTTQAQRRAA